ncbi:hypothetical protein Hanom_Chr10g00916351 [Helianthus anomalus]
MKHFISSLSIPTTNTHTYDSSIYTQTRQNIYRLHPIPSRLTSGDAKRGPVSGADNRPDPITATHSISFSLFLNRRLTTTLLGGSGHRQKQHHHHRRRRCGGWCRLKF